MPKPILWNGKCYIDFACELQLQSELQLNLYANGINNIAEVFLNESHKLGYLKAPGVVVANRKLYENTEKNIKEAFQLPEVSQRHTRMMYGCLKTVKALNEDIENKIENRKWKKEDIEKLYSEVEKMMSMMVFQWLSFDLSSIVEDTGLKSYEIQRLAVPVMFEPYKIRELRAYVKVLENLYTENSDKLIKKYVKEYAFLKNFEIDRNEDEDIGRLTEKLYKEDINKYKNIISEYEKRNVISERSRQRLYKNIFESISQEKLQRVQNNLLLMRICADEEEERHYQQARATKNFREIMEKEGLNVYIGIEEFLEKIGKGN